MSQPIKSKKERVTLSLRKDTTRFLEAFRAQVHAPSLSACVEDLVAEFRRRIELDQKASQMTAYYDSASDRERDRDAEWGAFAESEIAGE